jgi:uncharacterized membrane protein YesL
MEKLKVIWKNSWRHSFMIFATFLISFLAIKFNFLDLKDLRYNDTWPIIGEFTVETSPYVRIFILTFLSFWVNYFIEYLQSLKGANKGKKGQKFWKQDWVNDSLVACIFGFLGALLSEIIF